MKVALSGEEEKPGRDGLVDRRETEMRPRATEMRPRETEMRPRETEMRPRETEMRPRPPLPAVPSRLQRASPLPAYPAFRTTRPGRPPPQGVGDGGVAFTDDPRTSLPERHALVFFLQFASRVTHWRPRRLSACRVL